MNSKHISQKKASILLFNNIDSYIRNHGYYIGTPRTSLTCAAHEALKEVFRDVELVDDLLGSDIVFGAGVTGDCATIWAYKGRKMVGAILFVYGLDIIQTSDGLYGRIVNWYPGMALQTKVCLSYPRWIRYTSSKLAALCSSLNVKY
jgi:hypothetical protein